jgi:hypothetical protein
MAKTMPFDCLNAASDEQYPYHWHTTLAWHRPLTVMSHAASLYEQYFYHGMPGV